jgi:hypothetical protein
VQASVFTPADRTTAADREDDRRSVQRRLDAPLRLITQIALGKLRSGLLVLWNRNYFLRFRFRFRLLKSYGSGSGSNF